jgi:hypothetical protein
MRNDNNRRTTKAKSKKPGYGATGAHICLGFLVSPSFQQKPNTMGMTFCNSAQQRRLSELRIRIKNQTNASRNYENDRGCFQKLKRRSKPNNKTEKNTAMLVKTKFTGII